MAWPFDPECSVMPVFHVICDIPAGWDHGGVSALATHPG